MTASRLVTIFCDGERDGATCGQWEHAGSDARDARADARSRGWLVAQPGGKDYCPTCRAALAAASRSPEEGATDADA